MQICTKTIIPCGTAKQPNSIINDYQTVIQTQAMQCQWNVYSCDQGLLRENFNNAQSSEHRSMSLYGGLAGGSAHSGVKEQSPWS